MDSAGCYLFVYGTLRPGCDHPMAAFLAGRARLLGSATIPGRLYQLTWYPGLLPPNYPNDLVHGDLYELADGETTLTELDRYEIDASALFERRKVETLDAAGKAFSAWVYYYLGETEESRRICSGDFLNR